MPQQQTFGHMEFVDFIRVQHGNDEIPRDGHFMTFQWATHLFKYYS